MLKVSSSGDSAKLLPLRRFALDEHYSSAYLSLLVQRKTLKAKKIGRNFYTTREWFDDYLDKHARDGIRDEYKRRPSMISDYRRNKPDGSVRESDYERVAAVVNFKNKLRKLMIAAGFTAAVFVMFFTLKAAGVFFVFDHDGRVAGESEVFPDCAATTTEEMTNDEFPMTKK